MLNTADPSDGYNVAIMVVIMEAIMVVIMMVLHVVSIMVIMGV